MTRGGMNCLGIWWTLVLPALVLADNLALLSGTLRTYQKATCDEEWMVLRCPAATTLSIQLAQYGRVAPSPALCANPAALHPDLNDPHANVTCLWPAAIQTVVGLCQKKAMCKFQTSPRTFGGDPCPGSRKYVEVAFKCRPSEFKSVIGCEDDVIQLKCNRSSRLAIYSANFGRTEYESIQCPQPKGVPEESCLSSYATETVMQMCHGKRKCALGVDPATFGNPCKSESKMYLKVIHTCVPRKVLKEKYQGEPEPDEVLDDDAEEETGDVMGGALEQPSIYSPDHSKGWASAKTTPKPLPTSLNHQPEASGGERNVQGDGRVHGRDRVRFEYKDDESDTQPSEETRVISDTRIVYMLSQGIQAYDFLSRNPEKFYLYVAISVCSGVLMFVLLLLVKMGIQRHRAGRCAGGTGSSVENCTSSKPSSSSVGPLTAGLSDIDELSVVMDPATAETVDLRSILRRSAGSPAQEYFPLSGPSAMGTTTLGRSNDVVRFSNSRAAGPGRSPEINPRSLNRDSANLHFYYG